MLYIVTPYRLSILHYIFNLQEYKQNILNGLSVLVNDNNIDNTQVQGLVLNEQLITLSTVTLEDGTQAYVVQNIISDGS